MIGILADLRNEIWLFFSSVPLKSGNCRRMYLSRNELWCLIAQEENKRLLALSEQMVYYVNMSPKVFK